MEYYTAMQKSEPLPWGLRSFGVPEVLCFFIECGYTGVQVLWKFIKQYTNDLCICINVILQLKVYANIKKANELSYSYHKSILKCFWVKSKLLKDLGLLRPNEMIRFHRNVKSTYHYIHLSVHS